MRPRLLTAALLGFVLIGAAGCGGGGDGPSTTADRSTLTYDSLLDGRILPPGTYRLTGAPDAFLEEIDEAEQPAGGSPAGTVVEIADVGLRCTSDSPTNCSIKVNRDGSFTTTGTIAVVEAGFPFPMTDAEKRIAEAERRAKEAEADKEAADAAKKKADADKAKAEEDKKKADADKAAAEAERKRLEAEAEARRRADATEAARVAIHGHGNSAAPGTLIVGTIKYGEAAPVTTPTGPFVTSTSRSGSWSITSLTANKEPTRDMIQIYTDVEVDKRELFSGSSLNTQNVGGPGETTPPGVIDGQGKVVGWVNLAAGSPNRIATSGSFPKDSGNAVPFTLADKGLSKTQFDGLTWDDDSDGMLDKDEEDILTEQGVTRSKFLQYIAGTGFRDTDDFPDRWAYTASGQLQGASGTYRCDSATEPAANACTVQNNGGSFTFAGDWDFIPSSGSVKIGIPDAEYMWFGVWARQTVRHDPNNHTTSNWAFEANHGGNKVISFAGATGTATYKGPAAGRYAVYEPDTGESGIGSFTASATLHADFDASTNTVYGSITNFSNDSSWSLGLKQKNVASGIIAAVTDEDSVTWTIDGIPDDSGEWEAAFYSNLQRDAEDTAISYQPHGIAGTFQAEYDPSGVGARAAVIGAFGAHR